MKKMFAAVLCAAMLLCMFGCQNKEAAPTTAPITEAPAAVTDAPVAE